MQYIKYGERYVNAETGEIVSPEYIEALRNIQYALRIKTEADMALGRFTQEHAALLEELRVLQSDVKKAEAGLESAKQSLRDTNPTETTHIVRATVKRDVFAPDGELVDYLVETQRWDLLAPDKKGLKKLGDVPPSLYHIETETQIRVMVDKLYELTIEDNDND